MGRRLASERIDMILYAMFSLCVRAAYCTPWTASQFCFYYCKQTRLSSYFTNSNNNNNKTMWFHLQFTIRTHTQKREREKNENCTTANKIAINIICRNTLYFQHCVRLWVCVCATELYWTKLDCTVVVLFRFRCGMAWLFAWNNEKNEKLVASRCAVAISIFWSIQSKVTTIFFFFIRTSNTWRF